VDRPAITGLDGDGERDLVGSLAPDFAGLLASTGRIVPVRWIGEQHVREDLGRIPSFADWGRSIRPEPWMGRTSRLSVEDTSRGGTSWLG
jgi:hypothetical protein